MKQHFLDRVSQHEQLVIRVSSQKNDHYPEKELWHFDNPVKLGFYFFMYKRKGISTLGADFQSVTFSEGELFFTLPSQVLIVSPHPFLQPPVSLQHGEYFKLGFNEECMALLPQTFPFITNPFHIQKITFGPTSQKLVELEFEALNRLLNDSGSPRDGALILAHLHALLTEFNHAYFSNTPHEPVILADLHQYIRFKSLIEKHLATRLSLSEIASRLTIAPTRLYSMVKQFSGVPPKEYINGRIILEAKRKLYYSGLSVKELAHELGFTDPDYFSRFFKRSTGLSVSEYAAKLQNLRG